MNFLGRRCSPSVLAFGALGILLLAEMVAIALRTGTPAFFTLDDPYIHLALAERIAHGEYGINPGEPASPSSSILYPFLLVPFAALGIGEWGALSLNIAGSFGILATWRKLFIRFGFAPDGVEANGGAFLATLAVNGLALPFTGMEHTLHILCTLLTMLALIEVVEEQPTPWYLIPVALTGALLRYEGGAVAGAVAVILAMVGRRRQAASLIVLVAISYLCFSLFLKSLGLPLLPSSVLVKSRSAATVVSDRGVVDVIRAVFANLKHNASRVHLMMLVAGLFTTMLVFHRRREPGAACRVKLTLFAFMVLGAHFVAFRSGWFYRYEPYAVGVLLVWALYSLFSEASPSLLFRSRDDALRGLGGLLCLLVFAGFYVVPAVLTPAAARNIFEQQYQMHRFVTEFWKGPVAINDLGWVSYRNPDYVLDLWGLGSARAHEAFVERDGAWVSEATARKHIAIAMIYKASFDDMIPSQWQELAVLRLGTPKVTPKEDRVSFYLTDPAELSRATAALNEFAKTLPKDVALEWVQGESRKTDIPSKD